MKLSSKTNHRKQSSKEDYLYSYTDINYISASLTITTRKSWQKFEKKGVKTLLLLRCLIRTSLRHEKQRSFLFSRVDLLNRTDPGEAVRNVEYML